MFLASGLAVAAIAGTVTHTNSSTWGSGTATPNITIGNSLTMSVVNQVEDWYRHPWDGTTWEAQASKDNGTPHFTDGDRCLRDVDNGAINGPTATVGGHQFRTGTGVTNIGDANHAATDYVSTISPQTAIPIPTGMVNVDQVRFLTSGARLAGASYTVTFNYTNATTASVVVPIALDTVLGAARNATGGGYSSTGITVLNRNNAVSWDADNAGGNDCAGNGGDDVIVTNPFPNRALDSVEFDYVDFPSWTAGGWLGGPLAVSLVTGEVEMESTFTYRGEYDSSVATATAVDATTHAIWYSVQWSPAVPTGSKILLHLTCGNDNAPANGTLAGGELAAERTYDLSAIASPYTLPVPDRCPGRYLVYRLEFIDEFTDSPRIDNISFVYDPDADVDGYGDDGNATANDCNDNSATVHPGATEIVGDEIDQDCNGGEVCYDDNDNDGSRHLTNTRTSANVTCTGFQEGRASDPVDCNDNDPTISSGGTELVGDGIDQNCDGHDACYRDADRDSHGTTTVVTSVGAVCLTTNQEATVSDDCDDANNNRYPGNTEIVGDNVDENCNDREFCYADADDDNTRHQTNTFQTAIGDHNCTGPNEGQASDPIDCNDNDNTISPLLSEVPGNNKDEDCSNNVVCYRDVDNDGARTNTTFTTGAGDLDCAGNNEGLSTDPIDCDDNDPLRSPLLAEVPGNNKDDDCSNDATCYRDVDNDGARTNTTFVTAQGDLDCSGPNEGLSTDPIDCDDNDPQRSPLLTEITGDEKDNDCNGQEICWVDADGDDTRSDTVTIVSNADQLCNSGTEAPTSQPVDCDDNDNTASPLLPEVPGNGNDNDCNGQEICYVDYDQDGYRTNVTVVSPNEACTTAQREALSTAGIDCDDLVSTTNPGAPDICGNGVDDNCDTRGNFADTAVGGYLDDDNDDLSYATEIGIGTSDCDSDSDNDNLADDDEYLTLGTSPTNVDSDGDGRNDDVEVGPNIASPINTDGTDQIDALDTDDDNDGISSLQELNDPNGGDGDGIPNWFDLDSDNDGYDDNYEWTVISGGLRDMDGDGRNNYVDRDSDNDSLLDINERGSQASPSDYDNDGIPDRLDNDDDGDCVRTIDEIGNATPGMHSNFDGDSEVDYLDDDDDNDGETSCLEDPNHNGNPADDDTDGDLQPNFKDDDDDGDGIPTLTENGLSAGRDVDNDGLTNSIDFDSDGDGWLDVDETSFGLLVYTDPDPDPDFLDLDSDDDLVPDDREGSSANPIDTDGDGDLDRVDTDDDDDQIPTAEECSTTCANNRPWDDDFDGDGHPDYVDFDDDGDHVPTLYEDVDGSGDPRDDNSDAGYTFADAQPDYLDADDDGDGIPTELEAPDQDGVLWDDDTDRDGYPDYIDEDDDGDALFTFDETEQRDFGTGTDDPRDYDFDGDGIPNYRDADDDQDGVDTICEITYGISHLMVDSDGDTFLDGAEWYNFIYLDLVLGQGLPIPEEDYRDTNNSLTGTDCFSPWDRDSDGIINPLDSDDDGDGLSTGSDETGVDYDCLPGTQVPAGDGIPDYVDRDSDNDCVPDGTAGVNVEGLGDSDNDTIADFLDCDDSGDNGDSDQDGILNGAERQLCQGTGFDCLLNPDVDGDGVIDGIEAGLDLTNLKDTDNDGTPDMFDPDDEADGQLSAWENRIVGCDPLIDDLEPRFCYVVGDGTTQTSSCSTVSSSAPDNRPCANPPTNDLDQYWRFRCTSAADPTVKLWFDFGGNALEDYPNTDHATGGPLPRNPDNVPDFLDTDDDGDGRPTVEEGMGDDDGDGIPNAYDPYDADGPLADPDGDGLTTQEELIVTTDPYDDDSDDDSIADGIEVGEVASPLDSDDDGLIDALDPDDDDDTIPTVVEGTADIDHDNRPNYLDDDSDGDGRLDIDEGADEDVDCDGLWNAFDANDSDGPCVAGASNDKGNAYTGTGCGCDTRTGANGSALALALGGLLALRRRRS